MFSARLSVAVALLIASTTVAAEPRARTFRFTYAATVTGLPLGKDVRVWLPVPSSDQDQDVVIEARKLPAKDQIARESRYRNRILYLETKAPADGIVALALTYRVIRREVKADLEGQPIDKENADRYLLPDARVPVGGKPLQLLQGKQLPADQLAAARVLYDLVNQHMRYDKTGTGWGRGDAVWACENGYGNCTDFHSLFISLARSNKIPAKFEIGFPLPPKRGSGLVAGYHCWAKFRPAGRAWIPVDISEANKNPRLRDYYFGSLTEDRVSFSSGRDLDLVPRQAGPPLNFFINPYVEVDGKAHPPEKVTCHFSYSDLPAGESPE
jgi:transglutaminase-like putative cysteine protease